MTRIGDDWGRSRIGRPSDKPNCTFGFLARPRGARPVQVMSKNAGPRVDSNAAIIARLELPQTPWVQLQYAINFALHGVAFHAAFASIEDLQRIDAMLGGRQPRGILYGIDGNDHGAYTHAVGEFERRLSQAAFEQRVRLRGIDARARAVTHQDIGFDYFARPRGLAAADAIGKDDIESEPLDAHPTARVELTTDWREVLIDRAEFIAWLSEAYPRPIAREGDAGAIATMEWSDYVPSERDGILHRARHGEIGPKEAEEWALKNDQPPFASVPDPGRFDPMAEPYWSLAMAAAWIIWRTPDLVRNHWNDYRRECRDWGGRDNVFPDGRRKLGWIIDQRKPASLFINEAPLRQPAPSMVMLPSACRAELRLRLLRGELIATGIADGHKERADIPKHAWIDLDHFEYESGGPDAIGVHAEGHPRYSGVRVPSAQVMTLWEPMPPALSPAEEHLRQIAERSALAWLEPFWTVWHVLSWIAFRDKDRLCRVEGRSDLTQITWYEQSGIREPTPHSVLHAALRQSQIAAFGPDGSKIPAEKWAFVEKVWKVECGFRRKEVLRVWTEPSHEDEPSPAKRLSDDEARQLIRDRAAALGGFVSLAEGWEILRGRDPSMKRDIARSIVKSVIGNEKRGPRGRRRNSAE